jgi:hypothetical protein
MDDFPSILTVIFDYEQLPIFQIQIYQQIPDRFLNEKYDLFRPSKTVERSI